MLYCIHQRHCENVYYCYLYEGGGESPNNSVAAAGGGGAGSSNKLMSVISHYSLV